MVCGIFLFLVFLATALENSQHTSSRLNKLELACTFTYFSFVEQKYKICTFIFPNIMRCIKRLSEILEGRILVSFTSVVNPSYFSNRLLRMNTFAIWEDIDFKTKNKFLDYRFKQSNFIYLRNFFSFLFVEVFIVISWGHMVPINKSHAASK